MVKGAEPTDYQTREILLFSHNKGVDRTLRQTAAGIQSRHGHTNVISSLFKSPKGLEAEDGTWHFFDCGLCVLGSSLELGKNDLGGTSNNTSVRAPGI